jgi:hypothetical protein
MNKKIALKHSCNHKLDVSQALELLRGSHYTRISVIKGRCPVCGESRIYHLKEEDACIKLYHVAQFWELHWEAYGDPFAIIPDGSVEWANKPNNRVRIDLVVGRETIRIWQSGIYIYLKQLREDEKNYYCEFGHKQIYGTVALSKRDQKVRPLMTHPKLSDFSFIYEKSTRLLWHYVESGIELPLFEQYFFSI